MIVLIRSYEGERKLCTKLPRLTLTPVEDNTLHLTASTNSLNVIFCQKKGHLARVCLSKQHANPSSAGGRAQFKPPRQPGRTRLVDSTQQYTGEPDTYSLFTVTGHSDRPLLVTVEISGTTSDMEVDTGASCSLVSETTYNKLKTQTGLPPLQSTAAELRTYTGEQIPILDILEIPVCYHNQKVTVELLVVKGDGPRAEIGFNRSL